MAYVGVNQTSSNAFRGEWLDSMSSGLAFPNGVVAPSRTAITTNLAGWEYAVNDYFDGSIQFNHDCQQSSHLDFHIHFCFPSQPTAGYNLAFQLYYAYAPIDGAFSEVAATPVPYTVAASDNKIHRYLELGSLTGDATSSRSAIALVRVKRITRLSGTECDVNPILLHCDCHYQSRFPGGTVNET